MRLTRTLVAALAAALAAATPASATGAGANHLCGTGQACSGAIQDVPAVLESGSDVAVACNAQTPVAGGREGTSSTVQATIVQCFIRGNLGDEHYTTKILTQGQTSSLVHKFDAQNDNLLSRVYHLWVGAGYFSNDGEFVDVSNFTNVSTFQVGTDG